MIIPTRPGHGPAARCVRALLGQLTPEDEVIVSVDGPVADARLESLAADGRVRLVRGEPVGPGGARNRALDEARGGVVVLLNDDVVPQAGLVEAHVAAHGDPDGAAMVLGSAPWGVGADDRVIDRLVRETSWIFFYDRMSANEPGRDWGFRHAWTLNLSLPREAAVRFDERLAYPMLDDLEWAWRVGLPVRYRPGAAAVHEHRYEARALLRREALLGHQATLLHGLNPACAHDAFGTRFLPAQAGVREAVAGLVDDAADGFRVFEDIAAAPARVIGSHDHLMGVFNTCRAWRETARLIGSVHASDGLDAAAAMDAAETAIAGARPRVALGGAA